ncbi:MAG: tRNA (guanosine(46)-N7)-methyltransferase TrmB [Bacteroidales bacterium]|jgi:tRNA (guanine-N7-)-methyltransferase|nr:tRNA (guanosine(46)-N7)-methyltransferase TrmB [Bacteroidales bacterium]MDD4234440.1 tRNA (guanosine(46)-N7)-methyltransferase TrmB [Bacteroidales bacterium]MDY0160296.1 tRNA (guanosine(46)-N7)-methyltransferase TrmB [Bacteroidales bacterium]
MARNGKLEKFEENKSFSHVFEPSYTALQQNDLAYKNKWNSDFFKNNNKIIAELGCGKGEYTVALAEQNTENNYIGVDIKGARIWKGAKQSHEKQLKNVAFVRTRIEFLPKCFGKEEIDEIWITFPDPQLRRKKRVKKRLTSSRFLAYYQRFVKNNAIIHLKTDDDELYRYTHEVLKTNNLNIVRDIHDLYNSGVEDPFLNIKTFYEKMWLNEGKTIKVVSFKLPIEKNLIEPKFEED